MPLHPDAVLPRDSGDLSDLHLEIAHAFARGLAQVGDLFAVSFGESATQTAMRALLVDTIMPVSFRDECRSSFDRFGWRAFLDQGAESGTIDMVGMVSLWRSAAEYAGQGCAPGEPHDGQPSSDERIARVRRLLDQVKTARAGAAAMLDHQYDYLIEGCLAREALDFGQSLTLEGIQILSGLSASAIRTAISLGELHPDEEERVTHKEAREWLARRRDFCPSRWKNLADNQWPFDPKNAITPDEDGRIWVPQAGEGDAFVPDLVVRPSRSGPGISITVGAKGKEVQYGDFYEALKALAASDIARWRRRNAAGNWGIVRARGAWIAVSKAEIDQQLAAKLAEFAR